MNVDANKFTSIKSIVEFLGNNISVYLPQIHALTGNDTTSYLFHVSKSKVLKRIQENMNSLLYIKNLGKSTVLKEGIKKETFKFIQRVCYNGKENGQIGGLKSETLQKNENKVFSKYAC